ncbi:hypothetical protein IAQ61_007635 [Plenodomus lingam]|uniref:Uncharacterized protein n=1 Tax=Leptosphaeria maculans (strain JN3 / isolate v23.1.3 / race Av1-4-5-6-7-8) TaxID=985895 RepID=E5A546_LEPMJ|nr:hypothetical protein LEMA_P079830.1 [Plenodomus lingam JN3]KAH9867044.1 hypothetical protein IAQ61_007635 [Plenodomus lingam]CBX98744.1 hypothetical protein LEMA_P079830.1 [Plenodomus lingam JN3]
MEHLPIFSKSQNLALLSHNRKCDLINGFWPYLGLKVEDYIEEDYVDFLGYIDAVGTGLWPYRQSFAIQDVKGLLVIVANLRRYQNSVRETLVGEVMKNLSTSTTPEHVARSLEIAARLWLGINVASKSLSVGPNYPRGSRIEWPADRTLAEVISKQLSNKASWAPIDEFSLDESFTAVNLKNICRLRIQWTHNLADHLRMKGLRGRRSLFIYRHKILLVNHLRDPNPTIIDPSILEEAIRTLDLLFPFGDSKSADFLETEGVHFYSISSGGPRPYDLDEFIHWRNHLAQLLRILHGPPETATQTLTDTRNLSQFATLWVAIFGVFALTILFGILATVYSIKSYRVALGSYNLALTAACHEFPVLPHCQRL